MHCWLTWVGWTGIWQVRDESPALDPDGLLLTEHVLMALREMGLELLTLNPRRPAAG